MLCVHHQVRSIMTPNMIDHQVNDAMIQDRNEWFFIIDDCQTDPTHVAGDHVHWWFFNYQWWMGTVWWLTIMIINYICSWFAYVKWNLWLEGSLIKGPTKQSMVHPHYVAKLLTMSHYWVIGWMIDGYQLSMVINPLLIIIQWLLICYHTL